MRSSLNVTVASALLAASASATTWYVDPEGSFPNTLLDAFTVAASTDTVLLARGIHETDGLLSLDAATSGFSSVVLLGEGLPEETTIVGALAFSGMSADLRIESLTFENGGLALPPLAVTGGATIIRDCRFIATSPAPRALFLSGTGSEVIDCSIVSDHDGVGFGASGILVRCTIDASVDGITGGEVSAFDSSFMNCQQAVRGSARLERCTILDCGSPGPVRSMRYCLVARCNIVEPHYGVTSLGSGSEVVGCTFVDNVITSEDDPWIALLYVPSTSRDVVIERNIFAFNDVTTCIRSLSLDVEATCNLFWSNAEHHQLGFLPLDPSNLVSDPLFCDWEAGDYTLDAASPAAGGNCGQIGALGVGCGAVLVLPSDTAGLLDLRAHPNPFNPRVSVILSTSGSNRLMILDAAGRRVRDLTHLVSRGEGRVGWDGRDDRGRLLGSGVYYAVLRSSEESVVRSIVMAR